MGNTIIQAPAVPESYTVTRGRRIDMLVLHASGGVFNGDLPTLRGMDPKRRVSSHYYVTRQGAIYQLVQDADIAWHAGASTYQGEWDCNRFSIGVEMENLENGFQEYTPPQLDAVHWLCIRKVEQYRIPFMRFVSHAMIAVPAGRKVDPRPPFDFPAFRDAVYADVNLGRVMTVTLDGTRVRTGPDISSRQADFGTGPVYLYAGFPVHIEKIVTGGAATVNGKTSNRWGHWVEIKNGVRYENGFISELLLQGTL